MRRKVRVFLVSLAFGCFLIGVLNADEILLLNVKQAAPALKIEGDGTFKVDAGNTYTKIEFRAESIDDGTTTLNNATGDPTKGTWTGSLPVPMKGNYWATGMLYTLDNKTKKTYATESNKLTVSVK